MFKKNLIAGIVTLSTFSACGAFAQDNSIRFEGAVSSQTCNISVNDSTSASPIVLLQTANVSDLAAANDTSTPTNFTLKLTGCTDPGTSDQEIDVHFVSNNVDTSGNLKNIATTSPASNVAIQLLDPNGNAIDLSSGEANAFMASLKSGEKSAEGQFTAQYIATGAASAGNVEASVQYAINYF